MGEIKSLKFLINGETYFITSVKIDEYGKTIDTFRNVKGQYFRIERNDLLSRIKKNNGSWVL